MLTKESVQIMSTVDGLIMQVILQMENNIYFLVLLFCCNSCIFSKKHNFLKGYKKF